MRHREPDPPLVRYVDLDKERDAQDRLETAARRYAAVTHGNLVGEAYRRREEARDQLLDALAQLDAARGLS